MYTVTRAAAKQIQRLVAQAAVKRPIVCIGWQPEKVENKRGPNGESVWAKVEEGKWHVFVLDYDLYLPDPLPKGANVQPITAYGFEFCPSVLDRYQHVIREPFVDFKDNRFIVRGSNH